MRRRAAGRLDRHPQTNTPWDPTKLSGVVAWWHMDDLVGSAGATVTASPADRVGGMVLNTQVGTPTVVVGGKGRKGLSVGGSAGLSKAGGIGALPDGTGAYTVLVVSKTTSGTAVEGVAFEVSSSSSNGWAAAVKAGNIRPVSFGNGQVVSGTGYTTNQGGFFAHSQRTNDTVDIIDCAFYPVPQLNTAQNRASAGATRVTLGYSNTLGGAAGLIGEIYDVIVCTGNLASSDYYTFGDWVYSTYGYLTGTPYNTSTYVTTINGETASTQVSDIEPSIKYFPAGWNGHKYWMAYSPLDGGDIAKENPSVLVSDDANTWTVPTGLTNPVVTKPASGNNADAFYFDNTARDGKLWLGNITQNGGTKGIWLRSTTDGVTYSAPTRIYTEAANNDDIDPKIFWDGSQYVMIAVDATAGESPTSLRRWTASSLPGTWTLQATPSMSLPNGLYVKHIGDAIKVGSKIVCSVSDTFKKPDGNDSRNNWLMSTTDGGANWTVASRPVTVNSHGGWDRLGSYRLALVDSGDGVNLWGWYAGFSPDVGEWHLSQRVTLPQSLIP